MSLFDELEEYMQEIQDYEDYLEELAEQEAEEEEAAGEEELIELQDQAEQEELLDLLLNEQAIQDQLDELNKAYAEVMDQIGTQFAPEDIPLYEMMDEDFSLDFILPEITEDPDNPNQLNFYMNPEDKFKMS